MGKTIAPGAADRSSDRGRRHNFAAGFFVLFKFGSAIDVNGICSVWSGVRAYSPRPHTVSAAEVDAAADVISEAIGRENVNDPTPWLNDLASN